MLCTSIEKDRVDNPDIIGYRSGRCRRPCPTVNDEVDNCITKIIRPQPILQRVFGGVTVLGWKYLVWNCNSIRAPVLGQHIEAPLWETRKCSCPLTGGTGHPESPMGLSLGRTHLSLTPAETLMCTDPCNFHRANHSMMAVQGLLRRQVLYKPLSFATTVLSDRKSCFHVVYIVTLAALGPRI